MTMITVNDIVRRETPPKKEAAPTKANAPGSIHNQKGSVGIPPCKSVRRQPSALPYNPPMKLPMIK